MRHNFREHRALCSLLSILSGRNHARTDGKSGPLPREVIIGLEGHPSLLTLDTPACKSSIACSNRMESSIFSVPPYKP
ncbi:hypothetical protein VTK26DRAFT_9209 [Humicola hyalothermophila]